MHSSKRILFKHCLGMMLGVMILLPWAMGMQTLAAPTEATTDAEEEIGLTGMDFGMEEGQLELDPYDLVSDFGFNGSEALLEPIASFYTLCLYLSMGGMAISLIIAGVKLAMSDSSQGKRQFTDVIGAKVIVFFCISCFVALLNLFLDML